MPSQSTSVPRETIVVDGLALARGIRSQLAAQVAELVAAGGRPPHLAVVLVGDDPASASYIKGKRRACGRVGMESVEHRLPASAREDELLALVETLNRDDAVDGVLVQLPLPAGIRPNVVVAAIDPAKDVDGLHPLNAGRLLIGDPGLVACTPLGIMQVLDHYAIPLEGAHAVVLGRSNIVGKPMAVLLLREHATVTVCHSRTRDLPAVARRADILVAAIGRTGLVTDEFVKPGAVVIDVGMNRVETDEEAQDLFADDPRRLAGFREKGTALIGDVHPARVRPVAGWLTPVPGGVGPLTIALLLRNTLDAARRAAGLSG